MGREGGRLIAVTSVAWGQFGFVAISFAARTWAHVASDFSVIASSRTPIREADDLQDLRRLGTHENRCSCGVDPWRCSARWYGSGAITRGTRRRARRQAWVAVAPTLLRAADIPSPASCARRWRGATSTRSPGSRPRHPSAAALSAASASRRATPSRSPRPDRGPHRRRLGALGPAVDAAPPGCLPALVPPWAPTGACITRLGGAAGGSGIRSKNASADALARRHRAAAFLDHVEKRDAQGSGPSSWRS